jgi:cell division protein FtsB
MKVRQARPKSQVPRRRRLRFRPARFLTAIIVLNVLIVLFSQQLQFYRADRRVSELRTAISVERARTELLQAELAYRDTEEFIERIARRELGLVYPGEIPVVSGIRP